MKTTPSATPAIIHHNWWVIDAEQVILGRLASLVAMKLRGKDKPIYTPNLDCGDHVIVVNAKKVKLTGKKLEQKTYYWHTGHPGGIKQRTAKAIINGAHPERVFYKAVERMISRNPLGRRQMRKLHVYAGPEHPHQSQTPVSLDVAILNPKNKR